MDWNAVALPTLLGICVLVAVTAGALAARGVSRWFAPALAVLRATAQLAALSLVLSAVIEDLAWVWLALLVMLVAAVLTAGRRIGADARLLLRLALAMVVAAGTTLAVVFFTGAITVTPQNVLAVGGIVVGNTMSIATLTGRRYRASVVERRDEVEGWLALGATPRQSTLEIARNAVFEALVPAVDQTRTTGMVVLPGAFVGAVFAGASPLEAGRFQLVVLAGILCAGALVAVGLVEALSRARTVPVE
ncbi:ABC transporter permease [Kocuria dechangensis]|uniref:ABC transporter permease n=1 Tax=Kocuria dechangensis TaxID=1176249 RepID=A0A917LMV7_9MICC|nr:ABC transporter permease [Kocuria dechangensis]GGG45205.1 ABC transporter permease [Kocuria dechangensis]